MGSGRIGEGDGMSIVDATLKLHIERIKENVLANSAMLPRLIRIQNRSAASRKGVVDAYDAGADWAQSLRRKAP